MKEKFDRVYQFKITLESSKPPIWRRIQVPETYTFWDLHIAIQNAMGWFNSHLHEFTVFSPHRGTEVHVGIPVGELEAVREILSCSEETIAEYFSMENKRGLYVYDFGDSWEHKVIFEKAVPREKGTRYPICIAGKRACPPEDCGGIWGYEELCSGESEFQEDFEDFDPEYFDVKDVVFGDPDESPRILFA